MLKIFVAKDVEDSKAGGTGDRISAEGAEELHAVVERGGNFGSGDNGGERKGVSNGLAKDGDVRNNALGFKTPEVRAEPPEANLNFVGNADAAGSANMLIDFGEIIWRKNDLTRDAG